MPSYESSSYVPEVVGDTPLGSAHIPSLYQMISNSFRSWLSRLFRAARRGIILSWLKLVRWVLRTFNLNIEQKSKLIEMVVERQNNVRHLFLNDVVSFQPFITKLSHSHPVAGSIRSAFDRYMTTTCYAAGYVPYEVSRSRTSLGSGNRLFFAHKDVMTPFLAASVGPEHALVMCDVDYYVDMNEYLKMFKPILMYTFCPSVVARRSGDMSYHVISENEIEFVVAGGSRYQHELWDYNTDVASVYDDNFNLCIYNVEYRNIPCDVDHKYVVVTPVARVPFPYSALLGDPLPLKRRILSDGNTASMYDPITDSLSIGPVGGWESVNTTGKLYNSLQSRMRNKTAPPMVSDVERLLLANQQDKAQATLDAPILFEHLSLKSAFPTVSTNGDVSYEPLGPLATEDGKASMVRTCSNLISEPSLAPVKCYNTDVATVNGRIDRVRNNKTPPTRFSLYAIEFIEIVVPEANIGGPLSVSEVRALQNKPAQQARFRMAEATLTTNVSNRLQCFVKAEPYASVNDPRNITTMSAELTTMLSCYTLAYKRDCLKGKHSWYGPGLTPRETIIRLRELGDQNRNFLAIDYTRLDGSVSKWLQNNVVNAGYMRWAGPQYKAELQHLLQQVFKRTGNTAFGKRFDAGYGVRSGSPQTTDGNTEIGAFVVYAALRELGYTRDEALELMGLYYGDDGAQTEVDGLADMILLVSRNLGLIVKIDLIMRGSPLPYLGRYFVDVTTSDDSFQDPWRTIGKIHLTTQKSLTYQQAATNKASGYLATDANTPIIGTWAKRVLDITKLQPKHLDNEMLFKISNAWPLANKENLFAPMSAIMGVSEGELRAMDASLKRVRALHEFPVIFDNHREVKIPAIVDGLIVYPRAARDVDSNGTKLLEREIVVDLIVFEVKYEPRVRSNVGNREVVAQVETTIEPSTTETGRRHRRRRQRKSAKGREAGSSSQTIEGGAPGANPGTTQSMDGTGPTTLSRIVNGSGFVEFVPGATAHQGKSVE